MLFRSSINWDAAAKLIEARLGAAWLHAEIGLYLRASVRLRGDRLGLLEELGAARPERGFEQNSAVDPADFAIGGANFYVVVAAGEDFHVIAVVKGVHGLANLRDAAPERDAALANVAVAQNFVFRAKEPRDDADDDEQRDGDEELALHATLPEMMLADFAIAARAQTFCLLWGHSTS